MAKESIADKMARKAFFRNDFQKSWQAHMAAFGPILKPAFEGNYQAKIHMTAALNHISSNNLAQALPKLQGLQKFCETEADKAALLFCMALYSEVAGSQEQMLAYYNAANQCGHNFYLPYLKVGKFFLNGRMYQEAEENIRKAINCFEATGLSKQDALILSSAHTNLASCLTMTHRYDEAEAALATSRSLYPDAPGRAAPEAALYAIRGNAEQVAACIEVLKAENEDIAAAVKESTDKILAGTDPVFFPVPVEEEKMAAFWKWYATYEAELKEKLDAEQYDDGLTPIAKELLATFPFLEEIPNVGLGKNAAGYVLELKDYYAVGIVDAYEKLLARCPAEIKEKWQFVIAH